jgi:hypothetical protein
MLICVRRRHDLCLLLSLHDHYSQRDTFKRGTTGPGCCVQFMCETPHRGVSIDIVIVKQTSKQSEA